MNVQVELFERIGGRPLATVSLPLGCEPTDEVAVCRRLVFIGRTLASVDIDCTVSVLIDEDAEVELMIAERTPPEGIDAIDISPRALRQLSDSARER